ncbi:uncharacterized protein LOC128743568 [Sabethes cyaneus]|uniref:uncharacterized protein LOC128743568 n=1 Tax=Sabethes cyaneus TaxID=53552 RepID=UPI00237DCC42|nr:uncharacterized protein LOC128743568 [Sabethes cyaneus]
MYTYVVLFVSLNVIASICTPIARIKRQHFTRPEACTVSHQEIEELINITKHLNETVANAQLDTRSGFDEPINQDKCSRKLTEFRATVQGVIKTFKSIDLNTMNKAQFEGAKSRYQTDIHRLLQRIDNLKREVEDSYRGEVDSLRNNMHQFKSQLDDNVRLLEMEQTKTKDALVLLCIANIRAGRIEEAMKNFSNLDKLSYRKIISEVYENDPANADLVMDFLEAIDLYREPIEGYEILFGFMQKNNQLNGSGGRRLLIHIMALTTAEDEHSERAARLLTLFKSSV